MILTNSERPLSLLLFFSSNFYLGFKQGYFDLNATENPVLHIWSLAVEEQYYLVFPLFLLFVYKKSLEFKIYF